MVGVTIGRDKQTALLTVIFFFLKRASFVIAIVFIDDLVISLALLQFASASYLAFVWQKMPFNSRRANLTEILNEACILVICFAMLLFTHYVETAINRYEIGRVYLIIIVGNMALQLIILMLISGKAIISALKKN